MFCFSQSPSTYIRVDDIVCLFFRCQNKARKKIKGLHASVGLRSCFKSNKDLKVS